MQKHKHSFSTVTQKIGYGEIAKRAQVSYQTVSKFAQNPEPGYKFNIRRRILDVVVIEAQNRQRALQLEIAELDQQINDLQAWSKEFTR